MSERADDAVRTSRRKVTISRPCLEVENTVRFEEEGRGRTRLTLTAVVIRATAEAEGPLGGMEQGWSQSFDKLAEILV
jgi:uncharacterized protein YndB with AHSA1/START domain